MIASLAIKKKAGNYCIKGSKIAKIGKILKKTHVLWNGHKIFILQPIATIFKYVWNKNNVIYEK